MPKLLSAPFLAALAIPAAAQMPGRDPAMAFDRADTDHDGYVDRAELTALRADLRRLRQAR